MRVRIKARGGEVTTTALLNSGFESDEPDIVVPERLAERLGLWPPREAVMERVETAGGPTSVYYIREAAEIKLAGVEASEGKKVNVIVAPHVNEVLLSDYVIDELGITVVSFRRGLWRHVKDPAGLERASERPELWE